ncbi:hypothetical protein PUNSTDRAFT_43418 [Punctularia strigosozonata HHB-11173 SS5]|uniref:uncharacterized protein n=1 Tax=Punctularia strigosozonata (strain HHB-11173) TaxID=741275 RepID=UPI0004416A98|nr:uncharacterized protein PUNSTDRAFT_43418 [Punctularia strigosozonata HHB-11173 SS5]EIN10540.1 hypothetical protein PUNSTDRAFT_43418 [Punctularia strigosozonata HHB-11173 SS5]
MPQQNSATATLLTNMPATLTGIDVTPSGHAIARLKEELHFLRLCRTRRNLVLDSICPELAPHIVITPPDSCAAEHYYTCTSNAVQDIGVERMPPPCSSDETSSPVIEKDMHVTVTSQDRRVRRRCQPCNPLLTFGSLSLMDTADDQKSPEAMLLGICALQASAIACSRRSRYTSASFPWPDKPFRWLDPAAPLLLSASRTLGTVIIDSAKPFGAPHIIIQEPPPWDENPWVPYGNSVPNPQDAAFGRLLTVPGWRLPVINPAPWVFEDERIDCTTISSWIEEPDIAPSSCDSSPIVSTVPLLCEDGWYYDPLDAQTTTPLTFDDPDESATLEDITPMLSPTSATSTENWCPDLEIFPWDDEAFPDLGRLSCDEAGNSLSMDADVDFALCNPNPVTDDKNIWFFWHAGYETMHSYTKRDVRGWHRRFSKRGWTIRVLNTQSNRNSPLHLSKYLDTDDPATFPQAFIDGKITGHHALQHTSDLVRFPLLLKYGGVYADVGMIQIGNLDRLWNETIANPASPYEVLSYNFADVGLANYFLAARKDNPFFRRCHRLFLKIWEGRTSTTGMSESPLLKGVPMLQSPKGFEEDGVFYSVEEASRILSDYIIQGQVITMVMGLLDEEGDGEDDGAWDGPAYVSARIYAIDYMVGSQLINLMTDWDGERAFALMSLSLPTEGEAESADQAKAREIVEACLTKSFGFKLAHGLILRVLGETLGSLWRKHEGSDAVPHTYAHWLRYGVVHWDQAQLPPPKPYKTGTVYKKGPLLREE